MKNTVKLIALLVSGALLLGGCTTVSETQGSDDTQVTATVPTEETMGTEETTDTSATDTSEATSTEETSVGDGTDITDETQAPDITDETAQEGAPVISITLDKKEWFLEEDNTKLLLEATSSNIVVENEGFDALKEALAEDFSGAKVENYETLIEDAREDYNSRDEEGKNFFYGYSSVEKAELARSDSAVVSFRMYYNDYMGGAHGMYAYGGKTYDTQSGKSLELADILTDAEGFYAKAIDYISVELEEMYGESLFPDYKDSVAETFNGDWSVNWYLNAAGVVIAYSPYTVGPYAMGAPEVVLPYSEFSDYINEKYMTVSNEIIAKAPINQDISGFIGANEKVLIEAKGDEWEMQTISLISGENTDTLGTFGFFDDAYIIKHADGRSFVLVICDYMSDDYVTFVYEVTDNTLQKCCEVSNASISDEYMSTDKIVLNVRVDALGTYSANVRYSLNEDGQLILMDKKFKIDTENTMTIIKELPVILDGTETILSVGTEIAVTGTNNVDEVYFKVVNSDQSGTIRYTKDEEDGWIHLIDGVSEYEYFDTIPYAG